MRVQQMTGSKKLGNGTKKESISALVSKSMKSVDMLRSLESNGWVLIFDQDIATTTKSNIR